MGKRIDNIVDLKCWVKVELVKKNTTQKAIADKLGVPVTRISEAVNGKNKRHLKTLILELGGKLEDFSNVI